MTVHNVFRGTASGIVVQAGDITGGLTLSGGDIRITLARPGPGAETVNRNPDAAEKTTASE